ncbi:hypothetical protein RB614_40455 [Phytohabitans sp. ZYX-F-186]|uniref:Uncharacterized protein n=1 Tax=Phytohabitans maris TaxID=3071409 RepID=A0ABU0ZUW8_9ACTN|nr:hypothetical protein [Phytohabitans sp. ZYX-F-186]
MSVSVLALAVAGTALAFAAVDYQPPQGTEPPKITDWMQGWGSVVGVVAGLLAAVFTAGLLVHEMREARLARADAAEEREQGRRDRELLAEERRDAEAAQARAVVVGNFRGGDEVHDERSVYVVRVHMANYGTAPILDVRLHLHTPSGYRYLVERADVLGPGEPWPQDWVLQATERVRVLNGSRAVVSFTDVHGRRWSRDGRSQPERNLAGVDDDAPLIFTLEDYE